MSLVVCQSSVILNAKKNPNFSSTVKYLDIELPEQVNSLLSKHWWLNFFLSRWTNFWKIFDIWSFYVCIGDVLPSADNQGGWLQILWPFHIGGLSVDLIFHLGKPSKSQDKNIWRALKQILRLERTHLHRSTSSSTPQPCEVKQNSNLVHWGTSKGLRWGTNWTTSLMSNGDI